jgi:hypothetical protein
MIPLARCASGRKFSLNPVSNHVLLLEAPSLRGAAASLDGILPYPGDGFYLFGLF